MRENFSQSQSAVTYDSDPRKLKFNHRDRITGIQTSIIDPDAGVLDDYTPRLQDADVLLDTFLMSDPYEVRQRNKAIFQFKIITPPATITPQPPIVTPIPEELYTTRTDVIVNFDDPDIFVNAAGPVARTFVLPTTPGMYFTGVSMLVDTPWHVNVGGVNSISAHITMDCADGGIKQLIKVPTVANSAPDISDEASAPGAVYGGSTNNYAACIGQNIYIGIESLSGALLNQCTAGRITLTVNYITMAQSNSMDIDYAEYTGMGGSSAIINVTDFVHATNPLPFGSSTVNITRVVARVTRPYYSAVPGTQVTVSLSTNSGSTILLAPSTVGDGNLYDLYDTQYDTGTTSFNFDGQTIGIGISVNQGTLADLELGNLSIEFFWETVIPQPPLVTPFAWIGSTQFGVYLYGSVDGLQYVPVPARDNKGNTLNAAPGSLPQLLSAINSSVGTLDNLTFNNAFCILPCLQLTAGGSPVAEGVLPIYNYYRILVEWPDVEARETYADVKFTCTALAREV